MVNNKVTKELIDVKMFGMAFLNLWTAILYTCCWCIVESGTNTSLSTSSFIPNAFE